MLTKWVLPFIFCVIALAGLGFAGSGPTCADPAGCIWLRPGEAILVGLPRITSGTGLSAALAAQQGAELAAAAYPASSNTPGIAVQPFFFACLPENTDQSSLDLAAVQRMVAVIGPTCPYNAAEFDTSLALAARAAISPLPFISSTTDTAITFVPDPRLMAQQAARLLPLSAAYSLTVTANPDPASQTFREAFCAELADSRTPCVVTLPDSLVADSPAEPNLVPVWVSLQSNPILPQEFDDLVPGHRALAISLSPPPTGRDSRVIFTQWIGPAAWQDPRYGAAYTRQFHTPPVEIAGMLAYSGIHSIHQAALETAERLWDGSWLIPRQAFNNKLAQIARSSEFYQYTCPVGSSTCLPLPLVSFHWTGFEYSFGNS